MDAPNAGFQHSAAPVGDSVPLGNIVHLDGLTEASNPTYLYIDDPAGMQFSSSFGIARVANGLVQADRGLELLLQLGMKIEIVVPHGLFNHEQLDAVELLEVLDVVHGIC